MGTVNRSSRKATVDCLGKGATVDGTCKGGSEPRPFNLEGLACMVLCVAAAFVTTATCGFAAAAEDRKAEAPETTGTAAAIDASLEAAAKFLLDLQSPDGAWRGANYGCFRDGHALTPYVMSSLFFMPQGGEDAKRAFRRGVDFLLSFVSRDGALIEPARGFEYPVYTSAMASRVVVLANKNEAHLKAQQAWLAFLLDRRLSGRLGWKPEDADFGGWGFSIFIPRKPAQGRMPEAFSESNLSATVFGIAALRSAKIPQDDPVFGEILCFVKRCQNFPEDPEQADPAFDDGGFFFRPGDPLQNKAGVAGVDVHGKKRYASYGSMTADGLRALVRCGLPEKHPRVAAARAWLEKNFLACGNPGSFAKDREVLRDAAYYYWCWAAAHAFQALNLRWIETASGRTDWASAMVAELLRRQGKDGAWRNRYTDAKEDDPVVSTPWASAALAICRAVITGEGKTLFARP